MQDLIPHRPPMLLLDQVLAMTENQLWALVSIQENTFFYESYGVPACIGIEYLAQAAAAFFSLRSMSGDQTSLHGDSPRPGMLIGSRNYQANTAYFVKGAKLIVRVCLNNAKQNITTSNLVKINGDIAIVDPKEIEAALKMPQTNANLPLDVSMMNKLWPDQTIVSGDLSIYLNNVAPSRDAASLAGDLN